MPNIEIVLDAVAAAGAIVGFIGVRRLTRSLLTLWYWLFPGTAGAKVERLLKEIDRFVVDYESHALPIGEDSRRRFVDELELLGIYPQDIRDNCLHIHRQVEELAKLRWSFMEGARYGLSYGIRAARQDFPRNP